MERPFTMGKNRHLRKVIMGQLRTIQRHQEKIEAELRKSSPDAGYLRKWQKEIDTARARMAKLEERLEK